MTAGHVTQYFLHRDIITPVQYFLSCVMSPAVRRELIVKFILMQVYSQNTQLHIFSLSLFMMSTQNYYSWDASSVPILPRHPLARGVWLHALHAQIPALLRLESGGRAGPAEC